MTISRVQQLAWKRVFDVLFSFFGLILLFPAFLLVAIAIKLDSRGPIFFELPVAGRKGKEFRQWKFRTMIEGAQQKGHAFETSASDPRITRVGAVLRRWSVDELPQLYNVLRGEMSLVGPRPAFSEIARRYSPLQAQRLLLRPGLTGLAQVQGRNLLSWQERVLLDLAYLEHYSLWLDARILWRTIPALIRGQGIYGPDGKVTMHDLA